MPKKASHKSNRPLRNRPDKALPVSVEHPGALRVELTRIKCYERNPRHSKNPEYDRIKASILSSGLDQPLLITQRPGESSYVVHAGGNTRLKILQELYDTTGDKRFYWVSCLYVEWQDEPTVLLAHLRENDLRGDLTFIDKARAVFEVKALLAEERQVADISHRQLETILKERGYSVSHVVISMMNYALSMLLPAMPVALAAGLGRPQVQRIRSLQRVAGEIWSLRRIGDISEFQEIFHGLCQRYDGIDWQFLPLRQAVEVELAEAAEVSIQVMRMEFDCRLSGHELDIPEFVQQDDTADTDYSSASKQTLAAVAEPAMPTMLEGRPQSIGAINDEAVDALSDGGRTAKHVDSALQVVVEWPSSAEHPYHTASADEPTSEMGSVPASIERLRKNAYELAQRLAGRHGLSAPIAPLLDDGLGYVVCSIPPPSRAGQLDHDQLAQVSTLWWQLVAFAEMPSVPPESLTGLLAPESELSRAVSTGDWSSLTRRVLTLDSAFLGLRFWSRLSNEDWQDWLSLASSYREMHRAAAAANRPLWKSAS